jgi:tetratricopeptide (TPR) repeat protein
MATKKKESASARPTAGPGPARSGVYDAVIAEYAAAMERLRQGDFPGALERFRKVHRGNPEEPELAERAGVYALICERRLAQPAPEPTTARERFHRGVMLANAGALDEAVRLLSRALEDDPHSADYLYARASTWALKGAAERAVADLRQAIAVDPTVRFQAAGDPDFERIREEPSFIDIIEPTPTGA